MKPEILGPYHSIVRATKELRDIDLTGVMKVMNPRDSLAQFAGDFDLCVIDTPPTLGSQLVASLVAADAVITPVSMGKYEMAGVQDLIATIMSVKKKFNRTLKYLGVLPMKTNNRSRAEMTQLKALKEQVGEGMLPTDLPERAAVRSAVLACIPVWEKVQGESHGKAAAEWKAACNLIITKALA
jgi:chromosome partitioning protein